MAAKRTRLARARKAAGYTQEALAEALDTDRSTIVRWEAGETEPLPHKRLKLAQALKVTASGLEDLLAESLASPAIAEWGSMPTEAEVPSDPMKRRTLMKWGVAATATTGIGIEVFGSIGMADVQRLQRTTERLCNLDHRHGGETLWQAGVATVREANLMLEQGSYRASVGQAMLEATGDLQIRTGWLACDAGRHEVARASFTDALTISRQAGDGEIETRALAGLGFQSNLVGRPREGLRFSRAAEDAARNLGPSSRMTARAASGAVDGAVEAADEVLDAIAGGLDSWRVTLELGRVMRVISTYRAPGVDQLSERYAALVS
ncbi:helix-turn-helix transcriptional regulator [Amycolatopsis vastitatis]|uniref:HTH cro/C1-type domain-containing protein n=1 Tax=Amycolatopsis vastitatis TaxID=1905142 RepID=A0A229SLZ3_9PSEU|nr:helix-turn-helix transcriptional regulator [Amycolatopsis vastitatis]OXM59873.1 hypothetical protein CF165_45705 [Amycolatopsis vastitatis]